MKPGPRPATVTAVAGFPHGKFALRNAPHEIAHTMLRTLARVLGPIQLGFAGDQLAKGDCPLGRSNSRQINLALVKHQNRLYASRHCPLLNLVLVVGLSAEWHGMEWTRKNRYSIAKRYPLRVKQPLAPPR